MAYGCISGLLTLFESRCCCSYAYKPPGGFGPDVATKMSDYVLSGGRGQATPYSFEVLSPKFPPPDGIQAGFNGDYSGITVDRNGIAHPVWSDTRNRTPNPAFDKVTVDEDVFTAASGVPRRWSARRRGACGHPWDGPRPGRPRRCR